MRVGGLISLATMSVLVFGLSGVVACGGGGNNNTGGGGSGGSGGSGGTGGGGATGGTGGMNGGNGGTGGTIKPPKIKIGDTCSTDTNCGDNEICLTPDDPFPALGDTAGGPSNGYCTKQCADDSECGENANGDSNLCVGGYCFEACTSGPALMYINDPLDENKCHARDDSACAQIQAGVEVCLPTCGDPAGCNGLACDPLTKTCVDTPNAGDPRGAACDPMAMANSCAGVCVNFGDFGMCGDACVMGGDYEFDCGSLQEGLCAYANTGAGAGDLGFCAAACTEQADCATPNVWCFKTGLMGLNNGFCFGADTCNTDADCPGMSDTCIDTGALGGKRCLSDADGDHVPDFPLPGGTGGSGGAGGAGGGGGAGGAAGGAGGAGGN